MRVVSIEHFIDKAEVFDEENMALIEVKAAVLQVNKERAEMALVKDSISGGG